MSLLNKKKIAIDTIRPTLLRILHNIRDNVSQRTRLREIVDNLLISICPEVGNDIFYRNICIMEIVLRSNDRYIINKCIDWICGNIEKYSDHMKVDLAIIASRYFMIKGDTRKSEEWIKFACPSVMHAKKIILSIEKSKNAYPERERLVLEELLNRFGKDTKTAAILQYMYAKTLGFNDYEYENAVREMAIASIMPKAVPESKKYVGQYITLIKKMMLNKDSIERALKITECLYGGLSLSRLPCKNCRMILALAEKIYKTLKRGQEEKWIHRLGKFDK